jgi:hypothetical protein
MAGDGTSVAPLRGTSSMRCSRSKAVMSSSVSQIGISTAAVGNVRNAKERRHI